MTDFLDMGSRNSSRPYSVVCSVLPEVMMHVILELHPQQCSYIDFFMQGAQ